MTKQRVVCGLLVDETGSMGPIREETVSSVSEYIETLGKEVPEATLIIAKFNNCKHLSVLRRGMAKNMEPLLSGEYEPQCSTPLLDSMMDMIKLLKEEDNNDTRIILVVMTDGQENSSTRYSLDDLRKKVDKMREKRDWEIAFLGANMDSFAFGGLAGVSAGSTMSWTAETVVKDMRFVTQAVTRAAADMNYTSGRLFVAGDEDASSAASVENKSN